ncbi:MAG: DUF1501 domain-containing protein [Planctomycetota bacterium]|nr:DUF1501 domain-containing protein [Planctomycetota bacterium]
MLRIYTGNGKQDVKDSRRDFLQIGSLMLGSLTLPHLLHARAENVNFVKDKSVVLLYLSGGASQIETFDPKMAAPAEIRSVNGEVSTSLSGVTFGATLQKLAQRARQMSVIRSHNHSVGAHEQAHVHVLTGGTDPSGGGKTGFGMGALYARLRGANHPETGIPTNCLLTAPEIDGQYRKELARVRKGSRPLELGASYAPFEPGGNSSALNNMKLTLQAQRFDDRRSLLTSLDSWKRRVDGLRQVQGVDRFNQQAVDLLTGGAVDAIDLTREDPAVLAKYDTSEMRIGFKQFRPSMLGHKMLMARRLCEAGAGFVTVHSAGWDMHADGNNPGMQQGMAMLGTTMDHAVSAFLDDVAARGLSEKILLVITGDFGRTPRVNKKGGRDHWAKLGTLAFAGGGLNMGQVIGQSDRQAGQPISTPYTTAHLMGTIMQTLFDVGEMRLVSGIPPQIRRLVEESVSIPELMP